MSEGIDKVTALHTALIDSRTGYETALEHAGDKGLGPTFLEMIALRNAAAGELSDWLRAAGHTPDESGSFMSTVNSAVINMRALLTGLDESVLPGLIDGEHRIVGYYDDAIAATPGDTALDQILETQRAAVLEKIANMQTRAGLAA